MLTEYQIKQEVTLQTWDQKDFNDLSPQICCLPDWLNNHQCVDRKSTDAKLKSRQEELY